MKVVLDSSVIVAAFAAHGLCEAVFEVCLAGHELLVSHSLIEEVETNLRRKIKLPEETVRGIAALLLENGRLVTPAETPAGACRDPKDLHILGLAAAAGAECLVTGDKDLLTLRAYRGCAILTPRQFSDRIHKAR